MDYSYSIQVILPDEMATKRLGAQLAQVCQHGGMVIYLNGDLGAGKTSLVRSFLQSSGYQKRVKSPTYTLVESYTLPTLTVHHLDLYRFHHEQEWEDAGLSELFNAETCCLIEWPEKAKGWLPEADLLINWEITKNMTRQLTLTAQSKDGKTCLENLSILLAEN